MAVVVGGGSLALLIRADRRDRLPITITLVLIMVAGVLAVSIYSVVTLRLNRPRRWCYLQVTSRLRSVLQGLDVAQTTAHGRTLPTVLELHDELGMVIVRGSGAVLALRPAGFAVELICSDRGLVKRCILERDGETIEVSAVGSVASRFGVPVFRTLR